MMFRFLCILIVSLLLVSSIHFVDAKTHEGTALRRRQASKTDNNNNDLQKRSSYTGKATWFIPSIHGGSMGACWEYEADDEYVVAMNSVQYGDMTKKSKWCFKKIRIYHNGKHVDATVKDACPECKYGDLDLTPPVFKKLGLLDTGILKITWHEI